MLDNFSSVRHATMGPESRLSWNRIHPQCCTHGTDNSCATIAAPLFLRKKKKETRSLLSILLFARKFAPTHYALLLRMRNIQGIPARWFQLSFSLMFKFSSPWSYVTWRMRNGHNDIGVQVEKYTYKVTRRQSIHPGYHTAQQQEEMRHPGAFPGPSAHALPVSTFVSVSRSIDSRTPREYFCLHIPDHRPTHSP